MKYLRALFERSRWKQYRKLLQKFIDSGYTAIKLHDYVEAYRWKDRPSDLIDFMQLDDKNKKILLLRHDVDDDPASVYKMANIELELGIRSTFYFRWKTVNDTLIGWLLKNKFDVGLHYESLASHVMYYEAFNDESVIGTKKRKVGVKGYKRRKPGNWKKVDVKPHRRLILTNRLRNEVGHFFNSTQILKIEMELFRSRFGGNLNLNSICSHGHRVNREIGVANKEMLANPFRKENNVFEAYDLLDHNLTYISDTSSVHGMWRNDNPYDAIKRGDKIIYMLIHPCHWGRNVLKRMMLLAYHKFYGIER